MKNIYFLPEVSRYESINKKSIKRKADGIFLDDNFKPIVVIEIDVLFNIRNYKTLMLWNCPKIWIDYGIDRKLSLPDDIEKSDIKILTLYDQIFKPINKLQKKSFRR